VNFQKLETYLKQYTDSHPNLPGCDIVVKQNHTVLYRAQFGFSDLQNRIPVKGRELYCLYSCTKPITATGVMRLVENGELSLDTPVSHYLPCFSDAFLLQDGRQYKTRTEITVRHLLTMTAGLTYNMETKPIKKLFSEGTERIPTTSFAQAVLATPLSFEPGSRYNYSLCHDMLGALIEAVTDMPFGEYQKKTIFDPLGMTHTGFFTTLPESVHPAPVYIYDTAQKTTSPHTAIYEFGLHTRYESGGAGLLSTVEDYGKFAATMAHEGRSAEGYSLLKPETIAMMKTEQLSCVAQNPAFSCAAGPGYGYGLGVRTLVNQDNGQRSPLGEFGWDGAAGSYVMIDTEHDLSIFYATHLRGWHSGFGAIHAPIRDLVYECLEL